MSVNSTATAYPDTSHQPDPGQLDPEGTIIDWLRREAALERSFPYLKRKRSDTFPPSADSSLPAPISSTSSTIEVDDEPEEVKHFHPLEEDIHTSVAANSASGDAHSAIPDPLTDNLPAAPLTSAPTPISSQQPTPKIPTDPQWVAARLKGYRLFQENQIAFTKYPHFQQQVKNILNQKRESKVDPLEFSEFQLAWHVYKDKNEDTLLNKLLPFFMKDKRTVSIDSKAEEEDAHAVVSYLRSGLVEISNREFQRTCLPLWEGGSPPDKKLLDAMAKEDGMPNSKPDRTFGVDMERCPLPIGFSIPSEIAVWLEVMRGIHHPFFFIEGKSYQGNFLEAQNQACRGGATLVSAARRLLATLGKPDTVGPDTRTFVFSAILSPGLMDIWVHWAEVLSPKALPLCHMNKLMSKAIDDEENFGQLRKALHNIVDWGCGPRLTELEPLYPAIVEYTQRQRKEAEQAALAARAAVQKSKDEKASNKRRRSASGGQGL
ncbi:MAG: hypothetical protein LQ344_001252 [Seirophora lacunosa]|nr:MAG: hypothetical protein LQ344_001252 [Seirophora lacunosa]